MCEHVYASICVSALCCIKGETVLPNMLIQVDCYLLGNEKEGNNGELIYNEYGYFYFFLET